MWADPTVFVLGEDVGVSDGTFGVTAGLLKEFGAAPADPLLTLQALTFTAIPAMRLRERGLIQVKTRQLVPLLVESAGTAGGRIT